MCKSCPLITRQWLMNSKPFADLEKYNQSIDFQINNFDANGYHPFKGCYPFGFKTSCNGNLISERIYELLQLVMLYCGLDFSLRTTAGQFSSANGYLNDTAVRKRLAACMPWVKAILTKVFNLGQVVTSGHLWFILIDGSTIQVPGADGTSYRLHIAIDLVKLELLQVKVTDEKQGESLDHYTLKNGDVVVIDQGLQSTEKPGALY